ncbi:fructosamine kinase family protein [Synechococcus sp. A15-28]|uniref:fructosamine kinase family protein n=1 Tax=Synechococcus sp. A15-28 TaxID=1050638 RepID=UPI00336A931F
MLATERSFPAMHPQLRQELVASTGPLPGRQLVDVHAVGGGCIHQAWCLTLADGERLFAKSGNTQAMALFDVEAEALEALHAQADPDWLVVPKPLALSVLPGGAVLLLPWLELSGSDQRALGHGLALLHRASEAASPQRFGWDRDGYIGAGPQPGGWRDEWGACFVELRLRPQLALAGDLSLPGDWLDQLLTGLRQGLDDHAPSPALVHGDLWGGNAGVLMDGRGALYDPASWWADREVDLAMTRMFGGFSPAFYAAYDAVLRLRSGWEERVEIYNLYHLLNHANLFGGGYVSQSQDCLKRLARMIA